MEYIIYYKHTFGADIVIAKNKKQAMRKAIKILKKDFTLEERFLIKFFGVMVNNCEKQEKIHSLRDLIEEIEIYEDDNEDTE